MKTNLIILSRNVTFYIICILNFFFSRKCEFRTFSETALNSMFVVIIPAYNYINLHSLAKLCYIIRFVVKLLTDLMAHIKANTTEKGILPKIKE